MTTLQRQDCLALDAADSLAPLREQFTLPDDVIYLDGNSLGALPRATAARVQTVLTEEWGEGLIRSWNTAGWIDLPRRVGNKIARLVGAAPDELVVTDSTSINLYKVLSAALAIARADAPQRRVIVSERENFPTDLYMAQSLAAQHGMQLELVEQGQALGRLRDDVAVLLLTQVNYRSGALYDMAAVTAAAHAAGALTVWDLAHSAGAVPVDLNGAQADFAIGCGYKYLNGGPGAPAFVWVHARHVNRVEQPLSGWHGHAAPFVFTPDYQPAGHCALPLRHADLAFAGRARLRRGHAARRRAHGRHAGAASQVSGAQRPVHPPRSRATERASAHRRHPARRRPARQPGLADLRRRRLRRDAGPDRPRGDRRLPRRRQNPGEPICCASASPRFTCVMSMCSTPCRRCATYSTAASGERRDSPAREQ
jgi:Kynureninase (EC 3.7.1.3)